MLQIKKITIIALFLWIVMVGCVPHKNIPNQEKVTMPESFSSQTDSSSIGDLKVEALFSDSQLVSLIRVGIKNNQDVLIASQRINVAKAGYKSSKGALFPTLFFEPAAGVKRYADYTIDGVGNFDTNLSPDLPEDKRIPGPTPDYFIGFRSSWEVDIWGKLRNQKRASYVRLLASEKGRLVIITSLVAEIASNYYTLLALDREFEIIRRNIELQKTALETAKLLKEGGISNELAVSQLNAQLLNTQTLEAQTQKEIVKVENTMNVLLGRFPQPIVRGNAMQEQKMPSKIEVGIPSEMLLRRPDIQKAELELAASRADVNAARAQFLPSFTISSYAGLNAFTSSVLFSNPGSLAYGVLGGLSAPLFNRNIIKANYKSAKAMNQEAYYAYQKSVITGYTEVATTLQEMEYINSIIQLKEEEMRVVEKGVTISNDLFLAGYASYLEVINAQRNVLHAELELTNAKKEQFLALIALYRALGGGWQ